MTWRRATLRQTTSAGRDTFGRLTETPSPTPNVTVSDGTVDAIYGNGQTSYKAAVDMDGGTSYVPTVGTANITIIGGDVTYVYGGGRALTEDSSSADCAMVTERANITITGGTVGYVSGGGLNGPATDETWSASSGQDCVIVEETVITVSGGDVENLFAGGYNGQWSYTYKIDADGALVFSNYNGTTFEEVRNTVESAVVNVEEGASITNLYLGGRSYSYVASTVANITGGSIDKLSTSGSYGYAGDVALSVSGGEITTLELVTRNYAGDIAVNVTGGSVTDFYAGMGGAYKESNCIERDYNISTVAILGDVSVTFASGTVTNAYLTTGLERAERFTCNVPLTVKTMEISTDGYTGEKTSSGNFASENDKAVWDAVIILAETAQSFKPSGSSGSDITYGSGLEGYVVALNDSGAYVLKSAIDAGIDNLAETGGTYFASLADAYEAAADGDTITLLADCSETLTVEKAVTIQCGEYLSTDSISAGEGYVLTVEGTTVTVKIYTELAITPSDTRLSGGGAVTLTVSGLPEGAEVTVTCDDEGVTVSGSGTTFTAELPNSTKTYTFTATFDGKGTHTAATASCEVSATRRASSSGGSSSSSTTYRIYTESSEGGEVSVSATRARRGTTVTITVEPEDGYELDALTVTDPDGEEIDVEQRSSTRYTFEMPRSSVTVEVAFVETEDSEESEEDSGDALSSTCFPAVWSDTVFLEKAIPI